MIEQPERRNAKMDMSHNDISWEFYAPSEYAYDKKGNLVKKDGRLVYKCEGQILFWTGYNDAYWWDNVSNTEQARRQTDKSGRVWEIDFRTCIVTLISTPTP